MKNNTQYLYTLASIVYINDPENANLINVFLLPIGLDNILINL